MPLPKFTDDNARFIKTTARFDDDGTSVMDGEISFNLPGVEMVIPFKSAKKKDEALEQAARELEKKARTLLSLSEHFLPKPPSQ